MQNSVLPASFFESDVLDIAPQLIGKTLLRTFSNGTTQSGIITEVEAYKGIDDLGCHASKGRTPRTDIMFEKGGHLYIYLIYGMYHMLNIVTGPKDVPQAILIRSLHNVNGPGRLTKMLDINMQHNKLYLQNTQQIQIIDNCLNLKYKTTPRIGIDYAGEYWKNIEWRFVAVTQI